VNIALYIEDGRSQIVLTPHSEHEKALLGKLKDMYENGRGSLAIHQGEFYPCQGGWTRQRDGTASTIIVMDE
jgi:hypothetical protein